MDEYNAGRLTPQAETGGFESKLAYNYYQSLASSLTDYPTEAEILSYVATLEKNGVSEHDINLFMQKLGW